MLVAIDKIMKITAKDPIEVSKYIPSREGSTIFVIIIVRVALKNPVKMRLVCDSLIPLQFLL